MDPVTQTLAQQNSGSAQGQGFGQFFVQGAQLGQQQQRLNLANREENRLQRQQNVMLPYEAAIAGMNLVTIGQTADFNRLKMANEVMARQSMPHLLNLERQFRESPQGWNDPVLNQALDTMMAQNPDWFAENMPGNKFRQMRMAPTMYAAEAAKVAAFQKQLPPGTYFRGFGAHGPEYGQTTAPRALPAAMQMADELTRVDNALRNPDLAPDVREQLTTYRTNLAAQTKRSQTTSEFERRIAEYEERTGEKIDTETYKKMFAIVSGVEPKAGIPPTVTLQQYINKHIDSVMDQPIIQEAVTTKGWRGNETTEVKKRRPADRTEAIEYLKKEFSNMGPQGGATPAPVEPALPKVGEVRKGYRYTGKFPAGDRRGWEKVQ